MLKLILDSLMLAITTYVMIRSFRRVITYRSNSLADFAILILYIFQCIPVFCDYIFGIPQYASWYDGFKTALSHEGCAMIYDLYIIAVFASLGSLAKRAGFYRIKHTAEMQSWTIYLRINRIPSSLLWIVILSPFIHILLYGNADAFLIYASTGTRGLSSDFTTLNSNLLLVSLTAFYVWYFRKRQSRKLLCLLIVYAFAIIWISGKRYMVVTVLYSYIYLYILFRRFSVKKINMGLFLTVLAFLVLVYSTYYITSIKILSDGSFEETYASMRLDFGRDDVVKYVIQRELIQGKHILDYPLQTILSTVFAIVPRVIWSGKPYPHYRYLTASVFGTSIFNIPAGITPSILEMMICNFGWLGMPLCVWFLCWYCKKADRSKTYVQKYIYAMVMLGMLTQSLDSMLFFMYMALYFLCTSKVKFVFHRRYR